MLLRLFALQVVSGPRYTLDSIENVLATMETAPPRGDIYDRAGRALAKNENVFSLLYIPPPAVKKYLTPRHEPTALASLNQIYPYLHEDTQESLGEIERLASFLGIPYISLMQRLEAEGRFYGYGYQPLTLHDELTFEQVAYLEEHRGEFPGTIIDPYSFKRNYPLGELAAHLVGYTGHIHPDDPQSIQRLRYGLREPAGKEGVERAFEHILHGTAGRRDIEVDRNRYSQRITQTVPPKKGSDIYLTIDAQVQAEAQRLLGGRPGAIIVSSLSPGHEGEIIALASSPAYDPNRLREERYFASLRENANLPLLNRAYRHAFPPGSTFKLATATAALQTGKFSSGSGFNCSGKITLGETDFHCHKQFGHGNITFIEAIAESCDVAFYNIGLGLAKSPETIKRFAEYFGYGSPTGIELPAEVGGVLPNKRWKREHYAALNYGPDEQRWYLGDTANYSIGQGFLTATPLQVLCATQVVALDGLWAQPRLLFAKSVDGRIVPVEGKRQRRRSLDRDALASVRSGMRLAVTSGTCEKLNLRGMGVRAKSGTAETGRKGEDHHAWVTGYFSNAAAPRGGQGPPLQYAFVVFFQNGGSAGDSAIPAARQLLLFFRDEYAARSGQHEPYTARSGQR